MDATAGRSRQWRVAAGVAAAALVVLLSAPSAQAQAPGYADVDEATITPGAQTVTEGAGQCTANFVFTAGSVVYLGQAAHCAGVDGATSTNGCQAGTLEVGTPVEVEGAEHPGTLAYSSWATMQEVGESDPNTCLFNDFALVELHPADRDKVNPSIPFWGGPDGINTDGTAVGESVYSYGNSSLRPGLQALSPKQGASLGTTADGWTHPVYTITPGVPGDSGSAFLDADGNALGTLSTLALAPLAGSNGVGDLHRALEYAREHARLQVRLVPGTEPFASRLLLGSLLGPR